MKEHFSAVFGNIEESDSAPAKCPSSPPKVFMVFMVVVIPVDLERAENYERKVFMVFMVVVIPVDLERAENYERKVFMVFMVFVIP